MLQVYGKHLLVSHGVRTLASFHKKYKGRYIINIGTATVVRVHRLLQRNVLNQNLPQTSTENLLVIRSSKVRQKYKIFEYPYDYKGDKVP